MPAWFGRTAGLTLMAREASDETIDRLQEILSGCHVQYRALHLPPKESPRLQR